MASHHEHHFLGSQIVRDIVIGMADGLTVPFALTAGLSAVTSNRLIVTAGLAEIAAGAIAMGLGGYLAARTDQAHYDSEEKREYREVKELTGHERAEVADIFKEYGLKGEPLKAVVNAITADEKRWVDFMMRFELGLERPASSRARYSAATIAISYLVGGLVPLAPYMTIDNTPLSLRISIALTACALFAFGAVKGRLVGMHALKSGVETLLVGGLAASAAYYLASLFK